MFLTAEQHISSATYNLISFFFFFPHWNILNCWLSDSFMLLPEICWGRSWIMITFCITNSLLVHACHVVMHLHMDDKNQLLPIFIGFQGWTERCFFFFPFMKSIWNVLSRNKIHYTVIHWSITCPSCKLHDSKCFPSTGSQVESVPSFHSPGNLLFLFMKCQIYL